MVPHQLCLVSDKVPDHDVGVLVGPWLWGVPGLQHHHAALDHVHAGLGHKDVGPYDCTEEERRTQREDMVSGGLSGTDTFCCE